MSGVAIFSYLAAY